MKKQRSLSFGYELHRGKIEIHKKEAPLVRKIYALYEEGKSISAIAIIMNGQSIPYSPSVAQWNKHHIKRILENEKYIGVDGYPKIIDDKVFERIREIHADKTAAWQNPAPTPEKAIWQRLECGNCDGRILRTGGRTNKTITMQCEKCGALLRIEPNEFKIKLLTQLSDSLERSHPKAYAPTQEIMRMENEICRQLEQLNDAGALRRLILQTAAKRYELCNAPQKEVRQPDWKFYKDVVEAAILSADNIQLRLKQERKETSHDSNSKECADHPRKSHADAHRQA